MATNKGHINVKKARGFDKNPQNINRNGRPPRLLSHINIELLKEGYERVSASQIVEAYELLFQLTAEKITAYANDKESPMFMRIVAKAMLSTKGMEMIERMMDRAHGKALQKQSVESTGITSIKIIRD